MHKEVIKAPMAYINDGFHLTKLLKWCLGCYTFVRQVETNSRI